MICVHSKMCWVIKKNHVRKAITTNKVNQTAFKQLKKKGYYRGQIEEPHCGLFNIEETNTRHCSLVGLQQQAALGHL